MHALLAQPGGVSALLGDAAQAEALERVLRGWVEGAPRSVAEVEAERRRLLMARLSLKAECDVSTEADLRQLYKQQAEAVLHTMLSPRVMADESPTNPVSGRRRVALLLLRCCCGVAGCRCGCLLPRLRRLLHVLRTLHALHAQPHWLHHAAASLQALLAECVEFYMTGTLYGNGSAGTSAGAGVISDSSSGAWVVNPTLLQPGSGAWLLHYGALPFLGFLPLDPGRHNSMERARGPRALTAVCLEELATLLRGWQACRATRAVEARF